MNILNL